MRELKVELLADVAKLPFLRISITTGCTVEDHAFLKFLDTGFLECVHGRVQVRQRGNALEEHGVREPQARVSTPDI